MSDAEPTPETSSGLDDDVVYRVVTAESVIFDLSDASPFVHLMESGAPFRYLSIPIALPEAQALHNAMSGIEGRRPGTHELVTAIIGRLQADVIAVRIVRYEQGVFFADLDLMTAKGRQRFDCRTSDAIIIALRQKVPAPILCAEEVLANIYS
jgi:bifunctional DNase/RNase